MSIDFDKFLSWAESRFDDVIVKGNEIKINSVFCDDRKHHLWCNPSGGKNANSHGVYHCWKSENKGSLISLVMLVDKCTYEEAVGALDAPADGDLADLERRVQELFKEKPAAEQTAQKGLELPPDCYLFKELPSTHGLKSMAEEYLRKRKISTKGLFLCSRGRYRNRIVIPYLDKDGAIIYYNGRYVGDPGDNLRYMGPPKELGVGKGDVMYSPAWPKTGEKIYITEGEFDAMSLWQCGFHSAALGGKAATEKQISMIKEFKPVLCLDADDAGTEALSKIASTLMTKGISVSYVKPCKEYKDWNGLLEEKGERILREYVRTQERPYNESPAIGDWEGTRMAMKNIVN
jgi:DNA primase